MSYEHLSAVNLFDVKERVAVITGGGTGLGFIMASTLVVNGAKVYITGRRPDKLRESVDKLNAIREGSAIAVPTDVTSPDGLKYLVSVVSKQNDSVDILFANAGILITNPIHVRDGQSLEEFQEAMASSAYSNWEATLKTNVQAVYFTVVAFITLLGKAAEKGEGRGSVILTGSVGGLHQDKNVENLSYQSSKAAVHHLTTTLATKLYPYGIRVNCIAPGIFPSGMIDLADTENGIVKSISTIPLKRPGKDTDLAGVVLLLSSEAGSFIIGRVIVVDGGRLITAHG